MDLHYKITSKSWDFFVDGSALSLDGAVVKRDSRGVVVDISALNDDAIRAALANHALSGRAAGAINKLASAVADYCGSAVLANKQADAPAVIAVGHVDVAVEAIVPVALEPVVADSGAAEAGAAIADEAGADEGVVDDRIPSWAVATCGVCGMHLPDGAWCWAHCDAPTVLLEARDACLE